MDIDFYRELIADTKEQKELLKKMLEEETREEEKETLKSLIYSCDKDISYYIGRITDYELEDNRK